MISDFAWVFPLFSLVSVTRGLSIVLITKKEPALYCLTFCIDFLFLIAFNSGLMLILYFVSQSSPECMPIDWRERHGDRQEEGETSMWEKHWLVASLLCPICGVYPQLRYVPWLGITPMSLCCPAQLSYLPSHSGSGPLLLVIFPLFCWHWASVGFLFVVLQDTILGWLLGTSCSLM